MAKAPCRPSRDTAFNNRPRQRLSEIPISRCEQQSISDFSSRLRLSNLRSISYKNIWGKMMYHPFLWGIGFSFFHLLSVTIALKCIKKIAPVLIHAVSALFSLIFLCAAYVVFEFELWKAFSILAFCTSSYLFMFGTIYKSLTLRMLCEAQMHGGTTSIDELSASTTLPTFTARMSLLEKMERISI